MISVRIEKKNDSICRIKVSGHANFDQSGKDIVCASISTAIIMSVNLIEVFEHQNKVKVDLKEGHFELDVIQHHDDIKRILNNLAYTCMDLSMQYPKYLKIHT